MPREESLYPREWFRIGERELRRAEILLHAGDPVGAGFNIQQALEKFLKGFLLSRGWSLRRIHELDSLLTDAILYEPSLESFREACMKITEYYVEERYPFTQASELQKEEVEESLEIAKEMIRKIESLTQANEEP